MTSKIKKKIRIKCAAYGPDTKAFKYHPKSCVLLAAHAPLHVLVTGAPHHSTHSRAGCRTGDPRQHSRPSSGLTEKPQEHKRPKYFTSGYVQRLHLQIFPFFSLFSHIPVQLLLKRHRQNHASLLFLTSLPALCHQQKLKPLSE